MRILTPPHFSPANTLRVGVKYTGIKLTPPLSEWIAFNLAAISRGSTYGAPTNSNGVSVPLPTETLVISMRPIPGYVVACVSGRILGDGFVHRVHVASYQ